MAESQQSALDRLVRLRESGAISADDYARLSSAVARPAGPRPGPSLAGGFVQNAGSIAAGVVVGSLAADMIANVLTPDEPQGWEYTATSETTWTEDGYATEISETVEPMDGADGGDGGEIDFGGLEI